MIFFKKNLIVLTTLIIFVTFFNFAKANFLKIIVKINDQIITNYDLENEIKTQIFLRGKELNQVNVNQMKNLSMQNLINRKIKKIEIDRLKVSSYNKKDLQRYLDNTAKNLQIRKSDIKEIMKNYGIDYNKFIDSAETDLKWNSLIFNIYKNQLTINPIEIENEMEEQVKSLNKDDKFRVNIENIKNKIISKKKNEKLQLYSNSHFSDLKNVALIEFK
tara:strand:+ start:260 stop:913 length:654 start_codon:yes stop_codon:yes gene_type:complete